MDNFRIVVGVLVFVAIAVALSGLVWMLGLGILHAFIPAVPALGYWASLVVGLVVGTLIGGGRYRAGS